MPGFALLKSIAAETECLYHDLACSDDTPHGVIEEERCAENRRLLCGSRGDRGRAVARLCRLHASATPWPWYAALPPLNFALASHVRRGREEFVLPHWRGNAKSGRVAWLNLGASCYDVRHNLMPPRSYALAHPGSRWSAGDRTVLNHLRISVVTDFMTPYFSFRSSFVHASELALCIVLAGCAGRPCDSDAVRLELQEVLVRMHARNAVPGISAAVLAPDHFSGVVTVASGVRSTSGADAPTR